MSKRLIVVVILITNLLLVSIAYANNEEKEITDKIDKQHELLLDEMKKAPNQTDKNNLDSLLEQFDESKNAKGEFNKDEFVNEVKDKTFLSFLFSRKIIVPLYIILIIYNFTLISTLGSKNLQKRKAHIISSILGTVLFVFLLNLPIISLYFRHTPVTEIFSLDLAYSSAFKFIFFMKEQSIAIFAIIISYSIINIILGKNDIPKRMFGSYLLKVGTIFFIILQVIPTAIKLIL